jgi:hypothetical protein
MAPSWAQVASSSGASPTVPKKEERGGDFDDDEALEVRASERLDSMDCMLIASLINDLSQVRAFECTGLDDDLKHTVEAINEGGNQHAIPKLTVEPPFRPSCFDDAHGLLAMLTRTEGHLSRADERRVAWTRRTGRVAKQRRTGRVARDRAETLWQRLKRQRRVGRGLGARVLGNLLRRLGQRLNGRGAAMGAAS